MRQFKSVKQVRASSEVLEQLKEAILSGRFKPGQKLPAERELTADFQVSRVVVREAIRALELTGFVTIRQGPAGGAFVRTPGFDHLIASYLDLFLAGQLSVAELVQVRLHLEPEVARLAAANLTADLAARLQEVLEQEAVPALSHPQWVERNMAVDYVLAEACGNRLYRAILEPILKLTQEIVLKVKPPHTVIHDHAEHEAIVRAVLAGDGPAAAQAMNHHLSRIGQSLADLEAAYRRRRRIGSEAGRTSS